MIRMTIYLQKKNCSCTIGGSSRVKHEHSQRVKRSASWDWLMPFRCSGLPVKFQTIVPKWTLGSARALGPPTTFLVTMPSNHIFFSLCRRLRFVESKAAWPPWRQQSKFNICLWGEKRIVFSACTQSLHWLVQKSGGLPHPENDLRHPESACDF